jgi:hypothetical protein
MPDGSAGESSNVIILNAEDDPSASGCQRSAWGTSFGEPFGKGYEAAGSLVM